MEFVLICIIFLFGNSLQNNTSEELNNILEMLLNQIKNNTTTEVNNTASNPLNVNSPDESRVFYIKTQNNPVIDFIPNNESDGTDLSQKYKDMNDHPEVLESSQEIKTITDDKNVFKDIISGILSGDDYIPNHERNVESQKNYNEPENSRKMNILLPKPDDDQPSIGRIISGILSGDDFIPNHERNMESQKNYNEPENSRKINILLPKPDDDQPSIGRIISGILSGDDYLPNDERNMESQKNYNEPENSRKMNILLPKPDVDQPSISRIISGILSGDDYIPNNERNMESQKNYNEPENSRRMNILLPKPDDDQKSISEFQIPEEVLNIIKENHKNGNVLKEIIVEMDSDIITNPIPENIAISEETNVLRSSKSKIKSDLETNLTTTSPSPDFSNKLKKIIINKIDVNPLHDNQVSKKSKQEKMNGTKNELFIDPHEYERTVPTEDRKYGNGVQLSIPSLPSQNPYYNEIRSFELPPLAWIKRPFNLPYASIYPRIEPKRSYVPKKNIYGRIQPMPYIVQPRFPKWQISNALQNTISISSAQQLDRIFFNTDYINKFIPRAMPYPFYNRFQYL